MITNGLWFDNPSNVHIKQLKKGMNEKRKRETKPKISQKIIRRIRFGDLCINIYHGVRIN